MPTIAEHLAVLQEFHRGRAEFGRPLVPSEVRGLSTDIGMPVPPQLGEVLGVVAGGGPILDGYRLLDREGIARLKAEWDHVAEDMGEDGDQDIVAYLPDQVARKYWHVGWIPFLEEIGTGHGFALDTAPEVNGTVGQVVNFGPDDQGRYRCAPSLEAFLCIITAEITAGRIRWDGEECVVDRAAEGTLLDLFTWDPEVVAQEERLAEEKRRAAEEKRRARAARAAQPTPPQPQQKGESPTQHDPLQIQLHPDGRIVIRHSNSEPAHVETRDAAGRWIQRAVRISQPITISGPLTDQRVAATLTQLRAASGNAPVEVTEQTLEPLEKGWTGLMWAARHGRTEVVKDLIDRGYDPAERPRSFGGLLPGPSAYDLAMVHGHVGVMQVLVAAGVPNPVRNRPPGAPEAIVMRRRMGSWPFAIALAVVALGVVIGLVTRSWTPLLALGLIGLMVALMAVVIGALARTDAIAVDGSRVWTWRNFRWHGPVDLSELLAVALAKSAHRRSPTLLRLATVEVGAPMGPLTSSGFDAEQVERLTERGARVFTIYLGRFFRPGLERHVGSQLDRDRTSVSESARPLLFPKG